jgi:hypothetical protein
MTSVPHFGQTTLFLFRRNPLVPSPSFFFGFSFINSPAFESKEIFKKMGPKP